MKLWGQHSVTEAEGFTLSSVRDMRHQSYGVSTQSLYEATFEPNEVDVAMWWRVYFGCCVDRVHGLWSSAGHS